MPPRGRAPNGSSRKPRLPECGFTLDGQTCRKRGDHRCRPRAAHAVAFCAELCVHTKDKWARRPFVLADWQRRDIIEPLFGEVTWDPEWESYVRRYQIGWIELARKNGKSELLAFIALYLLVGDGVEGAEIYGCAMDRGQAAKVFDVAARMVKLSPVLSARLVVKDHIKRIIDERTGSYYEVVAADAAGNLGHNPHGVVFDEVLTQRDARLWDAMRTGMGTRAQPMMIAATTAGDDPASFARSEHDECVRIQDDPDRARHRFAYVRNVPEDADPWDEKNWPLANPALGDFLSIRSLRQEAAEARNDPSKENSFRQYRLNQWVQQAHRWMPMHLYRQCTGTVAPAPSWLRAELAGRRAYGGLDLAAKLDMTAWSLLVPDGLDGVPSMMWRFWLPEAAVKFLDSRTNGRVSQWADGGWITVTPGDVIDYDVIYADIAADCVAFKVMAAGYDEWSGEPVRQEIQKKTRLDLAPIPQTYRGLTFGMTELMALTKSRGWSHHAHPVAEWCFDAVEVRHPAGDADQLRPDKPDRQAVGKRIDAVPTAAMAITRWRELAQKHSRSGRMVIR
ncbi:terminase large subunit [Amycolatopsis sp. NPDC059021]|uniref:terminase large subunit n=1 Tax=Amycolatopsis sp. NPDC059021 TaxID=3346704 RepID=UPI00367074C1